MAVWSVANLSVAMDSGRFDADHFRPEFLNAAVTLAKAGTRKLGQEFVVSDGNHSTISKYFGTDGDTVPYFRGQDLNGFFLDSSNPLRIPEYIYRSSRMVRSHFKPDDVLLCIVGANTGTTSIVPNTMGDSTGSCKIGIIRRRPGAHYPPGVLAAFLLGKYGQLQIAQHKRGTAQSGILLIDISRLRIPKLDGASADEICHRIQGAIVNNRLALEQYNQAQELFESELGIDKLEALTSFRRMPHFSIISQSDALTNGRIDPQCFAPDALLYESWLNKRVKCDPVRNLLQSAAKGRQQAEADSGSCDYCSIKHITGRELVHVSKCTPAPDTSLARRNDLLLAITGATIGKIGIVKRYEQLAFSGDLLCLRVKEEIDPHFLLLAIDHRLGQLQLNRWITGSTNGHLAPRDVARVSVPRLGERTEAKIASLVANSLARRLESEELLEQAKMHVEQLVQEAIEP